MGIHIDTSEVNKLAVDLARAPATVRPKVSQAIRKTALDIEGDAKILAPVDTGALRSSIGSDIAPMSAEVGPTVEYGGFVEWGTSRMGPQPYMSPAFDRRVPGLVRAIEAAAEDVL